MEIVGRGVMKSDGGSRVRIPEGARDYFRRVDGTGSQWWGGSSDPGRGRGSLTLDVWYRWAKGSDPQGSQRWGDVGRLRDDEGAIEEVRKD